MLPTMDHMSRMQKEGQHKPPGEELTLRVGREPNATPSTPAQSGSSDMPSSEDQPVATVLLEMQRRSDVSRALQPFRSGQ